MGFNSGFKGLNTKGKQESRGMANRHTPNVMQQNMHLHTDSQEGPRNL